MNCSTCTPTLEIPQCTDSLIIGQSDFKDTDVYIFIKDEENRVQREEATTNGDGVVTLDMSSPANYYQSGVDYEMWVTLMDANSTENLPIWIAGEFFTCFQLTVSGIFNTIEPVNYTEQTLQLNEEFTEVVAMMDFDGSRGVVNEFSTSKVQQWEDQAGINNAVQTGTALQPDLVGNQLDFDGGDFMVIPAFTYDLNFIHVMVLVENTGCTPTFEQFQDIIVQYEGGNLSGQAWAVYLDCSDNSIAFDVGPDNDAKFLDVKGGLPVDTFVLLEGIFDAGEHSLDLDGIRVQTESFGPSTRTTIPSVSTDFHIGNQPQGAGFSAFLKGGIKGIRIFNSKLSATQRQREILRFLAKV